MGNWTLRTCVCGQVDRLVRLLHDRGQVVGTIFWFFLHTSSDIRCHFSDSYAYDVCSGRWNGVELPLG